MADDEKTKAEKLAAAKKRVNPGPRRFPPVIEANSWAQVEQMKKQKAKKTGGAAKKDKDEPAAESKPETSITTAAADEEPEAAPAEETKAVEEAPEQASTSPRPSISQQSKLRSASFRAGSISGSGPLSPTLPFSPEGETAADIYRKQVARIEDLEKENKRLAKEATDTEKRWQKAEEELADLRDADDKTGGGSDGQVEKLVGCNHILLSDVQYIGIRNTG